MPSSAAAFRRWREQGSETPLSGGALLHPEYTVVVPQPNPIRLPTAHGVTTGADALQHLIDEWVVYATNVGIVDESCDYGVRGQGAKSTEPRWSIIRNVLKWQE